MAKEGGTGRNGMTERSVYLDHGLAILMVIMIIVPIILVILIGGTMPYTLIHGEPVKTAVEKAGITIVSENETLWNLTGSLGGKTYVLIDRSGNTVTISTQNFDSAENRDAAVRLYNSHPLGKGKPVGSLIIIGQQLVYVTPSNSALLQELAPELRKYTIS